MNALLRLMTDLVEHAADTRYGDATNEMSAWRLEEGLADRGLASRLIERGLIDDEDDVDAMGFGSWLWLLHWRQRNGASLDEGILAVLSARASSVDRRLRLRSLVCRDPELEREIGSVDEYRFRDRRLPSSWLAGQVEAASSLQIDPFELTRHLLQIGTDVSLATLVELLRAQGPAQEAVQQEVRRRFALSELDSEMRGVWLNRLGLG
jgi:hypothetical protein